MIDIKNDYGSFIFDVEIIHRAVSLTLYEYKSEDYEVSVLLTDDDCITKLNRDYRRIDSPTDVLAFPMLDQSDNNLITPKILGDVVISIDTAKRQAATESHSLEQEVAFLTVHGVLHLIGYDHQTKKEASQMFNKQNAILHQMAIALKKTAFTD